MDACAQLRAAAVGKVTEIDGVHLNQRPVALRVRSESRGYKVHASLLKFEIG